MDIHHYSCIKILTFALPLFCLLLSWSWGAASTTTTPYLSPPSSALLAADILRTRGYSHFASLLLSISTATTNFSGTLLAPPDFAFSFATAKFFNNHRPPPRPSVSLLLYHTLKPPVIFTLSTLSSRDDGNELRTLYYNKCLFLFKNSYGGELTISSSPFKNPISAVKIRQPDLYVDDHLTVHGIDGILDPTFATKCSSPHFDPAADLAPRQVNRSFLDHAMRALRRTGYNVVAAAMAIRRSELLSLTSVTVFAISDKNLFLKPGGFRYDFRHHVVPVRHRFESLAKLAEGETEFDTLAPNKTVLVDSVDGSVRVDGIPVDGTEVYHNRWIVVASIVTSLDDVVCCEANAGALPVTGYDAPSPAPYPCVSANNNLTGVSSPGPAILQGGETDINSIAAPSPAMDPHGGIAEDSPRNSFDGLVSTSSDPSPAPSTEAAQHSVDSPSREAEGDDVGDTHCDLNTVVSVGVEGGDLFCPRNKARELQESGDVHVEEIEPSDADGQAPDDLTRFDKVKIAENVNIADDLFFYI